MATPYSVDDLLAFLGHAGERGLFPPATAQAFAVATRNVFDILTEAERTDVRQLDVDGIVKRFANKRARDFTPKTLKEYGNRVRRAVDHFVRWRDDPSSFSAPKRTTRKAVRRDAAHSPSGEARESEPTPTSEIPSGEGYRTSFPVRTGVVVTLVNIPSDLTAKEADRLGQFVKMLAVG